MSKKLLIVALLLSGVASLYAMDGDIIGGILGGAFFHHDVNDDGQWVPNDQDQGLYYNMGAAFGWGDNIHFDPQPQHVAGQNPLLDTPLRPEAQARMNGAVPYSVSRKLF